jgi:hypothetical protein
LATWRVGQACGISTDFFQTGGEFSQVHAL